MEDRFRPFVRRVVFDEKGRVRIEGEETFVVDGRRFVVAVFVFFLVGDDRAFLERVVFRVVVRLSFARVFYDVVQVEGFFLLLRYFRVRVDNSLRVGRRIKGPGGIDAFPKLSFRRRRAVAVLRV